MEEPHFDHETGWSQPAQCRRCRYPMARDLEACPSCQRPVRFFSAVSGRALGQRLGGVARSAFGIAQGLVMIVIALALAYYLSPLLLLFPLVALSADPPASRGGKTVSYGRRRR